MNINITLKYSQDSEREIDVKVNNEQQIKECLEIIDNSLNLNINISRVFYCISQREKKIISVFGSFKDNNITTGDYLEILEY